MLVVGKKLLSVSIAASRASDPLNTLVDLLQQDVFIADNVSI